VTVIEEIVVWPMLGAAGAASWGIVRVTGADIAPSAESMELTSSPTEVTVAL